MPRAAAGSMHLFDAAARFYGGNAIVGGGHSGRGRLWRSPTRCRSDSHVTCCFFGDGAVAEGAFHESMNLAALWQLPVLFVCENNFYAMGTRLELAESVTDLAAESGRLRDGRGAASTAWTSRPSRRRRKTGAERCGRARDPIFSSAGRTASARTPCTIRSSIAPRPKSRNGRSATRSRCFRQRLKERGADHATRSSQTWNVMPRRESVAAVAFAEAGTPRTGRGPHPLRLLREHRRRRDLSRSDARSDP